MRAPASSKSTVTIAPTLRADGKRTTASRIDECFEPQAVQRACSAPAATPRLPARSDLDGFTRLVGPGRLARAPWLAAEARLQRVQVSVEHRRHVEGDDLRE